MSAIKQYTDSDAALWREALEQAPITPGPAGGPEYVATAEESGNEIVLLGRGKLLAPLLKRRVKHFGLIGADLYEGVQSNSILGEKPTPEELSELLAALPAKCNIRLHVAEEHLEAQGETFANFGFRPLERFNYHVVDFAADYEEWFNRPTVRRILIRKARKQGVTIKLGGAELLPQYFELYLKSYRRWERQGKANWHHPLARFERMFAVPGSGVLIGLANQEDKVIACTMVCVYQRTAAGLYGGIDYDYRSSKASNLLYAELFRRLIKQGVRYYNMGTSNGLRGVISFKESLGGEARESMILERHRFPRLRSLLSRGGKGA